LRTPLRQKRKQKTCLVLAAAATNMQQSHSAIAPRALNIAIINNINARTPRPAIPQRVKLAQLEAAAEWYVNNRLVRRRGARNSKHQHGILIKNEQFSLCFYCRLTRRREHLSFSFLLSRRIPPWARLQCIVKRQKSLFELRKPGRFLSEQTPLLFVSDVTEFEVMAKMRATYTLNTKVTLIPFG